VGAAGDDLESVEYDRAVILDRLRYLPVAPFRASYNYSNFGMTLAGAVAAEADGLELVITRTLRGAPCPRGYAEPSGVPGSLVGVELSHAARNPDAPTTPLTPSFLVNFRGSGRAEDRSASAALRLSRIEPLTGPACSSFSASSSQPQWLLR